MENEKNPRLFHYLAEGNIICHLNADNYFEAISELCSRLAKNTAGLDAAQTIESVIAREKVAPTVISPGLAVPHAREAAMKHMLIALGTSMKGIDFNTEDNKRVNVVILILTPKDNPAIHLQILAALAKDFKKPDTVRKIAAMEHPADILKFFSSSETVMPDYLRAKDVMNNAPVTLTESDTLDKVIETLAIHRIMDIPIVDEEKDVRGVISHEDILRLSLPEHLLWLNDLSPILNFQPFTELLRNDKETKVADFMRETFFSVDEEIPAIQLAKTFLTHNIRQIIVTKKQKFVGVVNINSFFSKLFWA